MIADPPAEVAEVLAAVANRRSNRVARLRHLLPLPDPLESSAGAERFLHQDLARLDDLDLGIERRRTELRIIADSTPSPWLKARVRAITAEQRRRRGGSR